jgi:N-acetylglucosamine-6-sulfatase
VIGDKAVKFVREAHASDKPFFLWYGTHAPHSPALIPPRDKDRVGTWSAYNPPNFNERDVSDKPPWVRRQPLLSSAQQRNLKQKRQERLTSMLAVSRNLARLKKQLRDSGELSNTYLILTSDNGYHLGLHRLGAGKRTAYNEEARVPLAVSGPGVPSGGVRHMVLNTDLAPTIADLAGVSPGITPDGRSFAPLLSAGRSGLAPDQFRRRFMEENWHTNAVPGAVVPPTNRAVISSLYVYNRYVTGEKEYYNLSRDPYELESKRVSGTYKDNLNSLWMRLRDCRGLDCQRAEGG